MHTLVGVFGFREQALWLGFGTLTSTKKTGALIQCLGLVFGLSGTHSETLEPTLGICSRWAYMGLYRVHMGAILGKMGLEYGLKPLCAYTYSPASISCSLLLSTVFFLLLR